MKENRTLTTRQIEREKKRKANGSSQIFKVDKYSSETNLKCLNYGYLVDNVWETPHKSTRRCWIQHADQHIYIYRTAIIHLPLPSFKCLYQRDIVELITEFPMLPDQQQHADWQQTTQCFHLTPPAHGEREREMERVSEMEICFWFMCMHTLCTHRNRKMRTHGEKTHTHEILKRRTSGTLLFVNQKRKERKWKWPTTTAKKRGRRKTHEARARRGRQGRIWCFRFIFRLQYFQWCTFLRRDDIFRNL